MNPFPRYLIAALLVALAAAPAVQAQQNPPHAGYAYPAGGRQGDTVRVTVGGQFLERTTNAYVSGRGIQAKVVECIKPLTPKQVNDLRERLDELRKKPKDAETIKELMAEIRDKLNDFQNKRANPVLADKVILQCHDRRGRRARPAGIAIGGAQRVVESLDLSRRTTGRVSQTRGKAEH